MKVAWDEAKNRANLRNTASVLRKPANFSDQVSTIWKSSTTSIPVTEDRFIAIGPIRRGLVLIVWTERDEETIRIISARWATAHEQALYRAHLDQTS